MSDLFLIDNQQIIDLFEIKISDFDGYFYFHGSKNFNKNLVFNGITYLYIPVEMSNLSYDSEGKQNRPVVKISNVNNFISDLIKSKGDLLGKDFHRKKILAKDLDDINFGGSNKNLLGVSNFRDYISQDKFIINKKNSENKERVEFELSNILDIDGLTCPSRKVYNNSCPWQYRGYGCNYGKRLGYDGPNVFLREFGETTPASSLSNLLNEESFNGLKDKLISWFNFDAETTNYVKGSKKNFDVRIGDSSYERQRLDTLSSWKNVASTINTTDSGSMITNDFQIDNPTIENSVQRSALITANSYMNSKKSVCFIYDKVYSGTRALKAYIPTSNFGDKDLTVVYVCRPTSFFSPWKPLERNNRDFVPYGGKFSRGMTTLSKDTFLGFKGLRAADKDEYDTKSTDDSFKIKSDNNIATGVNSPYLNMNKPYIYTSVIPAANDGNAIFYRDGFKISEITVNYGGVGQSHNIENLGFNIDDSVYSEMEVYEVIIFNAKLNEIQVRGVNAYLSEKYGMKVNNSQFSGIKSSSSASFFNDEDGNMGVPIADENDKLFFDETAKKTFSRYSTYGFKKLTYRGDYNKKTVYKKGDFVKIDSEINFDFNRDVLTKDSEIPAKFFVCINENGSVGINPFDRTDVWIEDKCSKKLSGCIARFRNESVDDRVPFGGYPGTVSYPYELPN